MATVTTSDIRNGMCIQLDNDLKQIVEFQHVKPGKGPAFVRSKLKSLTTGKVLEHTFPAGHKVQEVRVERRPYQFLYKDEMGYHFMDMETFEQVALEEKLIDHPQFLKEGLEVEVIFHAEEERAIGCELPPFVEMEITYTEPGVKGDTATNTLKPATVESGAEVKVPLFIDQGETIKVDTRTGKYQERVN